MVKSDKGVYEDYFGSAGGGHNLRYKWYINKYFRNIKNKKILEIGCGDGGLVQFLKKDNDTYAVDISKAGVSFLKKIGIKAFLKDMSFEKLPFDDGTFDYVIILEVLEHLKAPQSSLEEIQRVLKKGGIMIASTPNPRTTHKFLYPSLFTHSGFRDYLKNNKFTIIESTTFGICPPFWKIMKSSLERRHFNSRLSVRKNKSEKSPLFSRLSVFLSKGLFNHIKPKIFGWSFVYVCKNTNPSGAKNLYKEIAGETKIAYA